jgi:hypothetical protein
MSVAQPEIWSAASVAASDRNQAESLPTFILLLPLPLEFSGASKQQ